MNEAAKVIGRDPQAKSEGHRQWVIREAAGIVGRGSQAEAGASQEQGS